MRESSRPATLADVAERAGVTKMTVSNVLNGKRKSSPHTEAILQAVRELNFEPNLYAQQLKNKADDLVAIFCPGVDGPSFKVAQWVEFKLAEMGYAAVMYSVSQTMQSVDASEMHMRQVLRQNPRAIVCQGSRFRPDTMLALQRFVANGGTLVSFSNLGGIGGDYVHLDSAYSLYVGARHLIELGHRKIGLNAPNAGLEHPWRQGFDQALAGAQITPNPQWHFNACCWEEAGGEIAANLLRLKERPTALCVINDTSAAALVAHLHRANYHVPTDLSIVGYGNFPAATHGLVHLTTVTHPVDEIADRVVETIHDRLKGHLTGPPRQIDVRGQLIVRESSAPLIQNSSSH